jgi:hypothetical protein
MACAMAARFLRRLVVAAISSASWATRANGVMRKILKP